MKSKLEKILNNVIDDFNTKWKSHEEKSDGISQYIDEISALLGGYVQKIHKNLRQVGNLIKVAHPAYKKSHIAMNEYVEDVACKIKNYCT